MEKLRIGIVGCGGIANGKHLPALKNESDRVEMVAFCDLIPERAKQAAKEYGTPDAKTCTDYHELIADKSIDVVHVCTPNRSHCEISVAALEAGKHVMCEKPMAKTAADARKMLEAAKKSGKKLTIGYQSRFTKEAQVIKKAVDRGDLGEIYFAKAHAVRRRAVPTWGVFLNEYEQGNQTETGNAWGDWDPKEFTVEDSAFGLIRMENGATIFLESSWALNTLDTGEAITTLCGTKAGADMRDGVRFNMVDLGCQTVKKPDLSAGGVAFFEGSAGMTPAQMEAHYWINAILNDTDPMVLPEQALTVTEILEAIYTSAKTGKAVYFD